jgi:hypothetical protein
MPKSSKQELATKAKYNATPEQKAYRAELGRARYKAMKEGKVREGDGKAIAHKVAHKNGGAATPGNTKVQDAEANKGWRRGQRGKDSYKVPNVK